MWLTTTSIRKVFDVSELGLQVQKWDKNNVRIVSNPRIDTKGEKKVLQHELMRARSHTHTHAHTRLSVTPLMGHLGCLASCWSVLVGQSLLQCSDAKSENIKTYNGVSHYGSFGYPLTLEINGHN